jgi:hypothetical protein
MPYVRNALLVALRETTYATDPTPTGANAIQVTDLDVQFMAADVVERNLVGPYMGARPAVLARRRTLMSFRVEATGSGAAGTAPGYAAFLRAAGFSETVTASTRVDYDPVSTGFDSVAAYGNVDGRRARMIGGRGGLGVNVTAGQIPYFAFSNFVGRDAGGPDAQALLTPTFSNVAAPLVVNRENTTFTLGGQALILQSLDLTPYDPVWVNRPNSERAEIVDHPIRGTLVVESVPLGTWDPYLQSRSRAQLALSLVHGTVAGNIVELVASRVELGEITEGEIDGLETWNIPITLVAVAGSPELRIRIR